MIIPGTSATEQKRETDNVVFTVKIDGKEVNMDPGGLIALSISLELNKIPWARIVFSDGSVEKQSFEKADKDLFSPGKKVEILLGYNQKPDSVFKGIITKQSIKIQTARTYRVEIECRDLAVQTTLVRNSRYYEPKTDTKIIQEIVQLYPDLKEGKLEDTGYQQPQMVQHYATDWDFMLLRADANGMYLNAAGGELNMAKPTVKSKPDLQVQFGQGKSGIPLLEFESELDARDHFPGVNADSWNAGKQEVEEKTAGKKASSGGGGGLGGLALPAAVSALVGGAGGGAKKDFPDTLYKQQTVQLYHGGDMDAHELDAWSKAKLKRGELSRIKGRVAIVGIKTLPGDTLGVNGVSDRFNGTHLITGVVHQLMKGHWKTDIQFGWDAAFVSEKMMPETADAAGLVPGIRGLHAGIVSKIEGDPNAGNHRVQVRIPFITKNTKGDSKGIWARLVSIYAGDKYGFVFRPEMGDEVIVGFINNDPNDALILGGVHSGKKIAPADIPSADKNYIKGFVAKGGMEMLFNDDKNTIQLNTGGSNSPLIELDGKNKMIRLVLDSSTSIELSTSGIKINGQRIDLN